MSQHGFYNSNEYRAYPFITTALRPGAGSLPAPGALPTELLVDCGFMCSLPSRNFLSDSPDVVYAVYLQRVRRNGDDLLFEFRGDALGLADYPLFFTVPIDSPEFAIYSHETATPESSASSDSIDCPDPTVWEGFIVVGDLSKHGLADGQEHVYGETEWPVEPALVQNLSYLNTVSLANFDRARYLADENCDSEASLPAGDPVVYPGASCLNGDLRLKEGWNITIRQDDAANRIVISAAKGAGAGRGCEPTAIYPGEQVPAGSKLLGGGPACDEVISTINGIGGRSIALRAGPGFTITAEPENNALTVAADLTQFAGACEASSESSVGGA